MSNRNELSDRDLERMTVIIGHYQGLYAQNKSIWDQGKARSAEDPLEKSIKHTASPAVAINDDPSNFCSTATGCRLAPRYFSPLKPEHLMQETKCDFCSLLRRKLVADELLADLSEDESQLCSPDLALIHEGPDYALRLEFEVDEELEGTINTGVGAAMTRLRLIVTDDLRTYEVDMPCRYVCLSYVWGKGNQVNYTKATKQELGPSGTLKQEGTLGLPQTIMDSIAVAREVGPRFLWLDALYIL
ncbi:hypothetical protein PspLS_00291 [Pyricularia sp. CBS 133598]|nr:hypothetical protein PspLS_00291 [Pyricularia sp. CBS 133598]